MKYIKKGILFSIGCYIGEHMADFIVEVLGRTAENLYNIYTSGSMAIFDTEGKFKKEETVVAGFRGTES